MKKVLFFIFLVLSKQSFADFHSATESYNAGEFSKAYEEFLYMAKLGEKRSQFNLGVMYYSGQHVKKDINKAYAWIKLANESETVKENERQAFESIKKHVKNFDTAEVEYQILSNIYSTEALAEKLYPVFVKPENIYAFEAKPITIVEPRYPRNAAISGVSGWVRFELDIDPQGKPRNIKIKQSVPKGVFNSVALKSIKKWRFEPAKNDSGSVVTREKLTYTVEFILGENGKNTIRENVYQKNQLSAQEGDANAQFNIGFWQKYVPYHRKEGNPNAWFLKSAIQGHPLAQYEIGRSLVLGHGCVADKVKGLEWLTQSAASGSTDAKQFLASLATKTVSLRSHQNAVAYLKDVDKLDVATQVDFAWMLITSPYEEVSDPKRAIKLINDLPRKSFSDDVTKYEMKAAAYAAIGDFDKAVDIQEDALDEAEDLKVDLAQVKSRLAAYRQNKKWF